MVRITEKKVSSKSRDERKVGKGSIIRKRHDDDEDETLRHKKVRKAYDEDDEPVKKSKKSKSKPDEKPKKSSRNNETGIERDHDLPWCDKKVRLFKTLKQLDALSPKTAVQNRDVVNRSNERLNSKDVRHYSYHARALKDHEGKPRKGPLIDITNPNDTSGYLFYLTKLGAKVDPNEEFKKQEAKKSKD